MNDSRDESKFDKYLRLTVDKHTHCWGLWEKTGPVTRPSVRKSRASNGQDIYGIALLCKDRKLTDLVLGGYTLLASLLVLMREHFNYDPTADLDFPAMNVWTDQSV